MQFNIKYTYHPNVQCRLGSARMPDSQAIYGIVDDTNIVYSDKSDFYSILTKQKNKKLEAL